MRTHRWTTTTMTMAALLLVAPMSARTALAQHRRAPAGHSGVWLSGGLGGGTTSDDEGGAAGYFRLGGTTSRNVLLGGEVIGLSYDEGDAQVSFGNATFDVLYYPAPAGGFFAKGGIGFASVTVSQDIAGGTFTSDDQGLGLTLGVGYDIRIGSNLYLTPNVDLLHQRFDEDREATIWLFTLGIGMH
ncbi:MAG: hypothetical protein PVF05_03550 [Gemmatimonadales bacterium]|jgi:hypothetical protein